MPSSSPFWLTGPDGDDPAVAKPKRTRPLIERMPPRWILLVLLCGVLIVRGRVMLSFSDSLFDDPDGYRNIAIRLYVNGEFAVWNGLTGLRLTAYRPPLYPLLLAPFEQLEAEHYLVGILHVLLGVGTVWAVFRLGHLWGLRPAGSLLAGALVTFDPILLNQSVQIMTETLATLLAAVSLIAITRSARAASIRWGIFAGCLFGLCDVCRPTFLAWLIGVVVVLPFCVESSRRRAVAVVTGFVVAVAAVLAPWAIRNQTTFGRPIITTTHGGYTLLLGNNPQFYEYLRDGAWGTVWDATPFNQRWTAEMDKIPYRKNTVNVYSPYVPDEVAVDTRAYQLAFENIRNEPLMFAYACLVRVGRLWGVLPHQVDPQESARRSVLRYVVAVWYAAELLLAAAGMWMLGRNFLRSPWIWGALLLLSFTAVHTFYWTDLRMRAPLASVVALLAASGVVAIVRGRRDATPLLEAT
jgi:hypothetical protein